MEDPLREISLFPHNLTLKPTHIHDPNSLHHFVKSLAKTTIDQSKELLNPEFTSFLTENNEHEAVVANGKEILRGQRPGLGRKKAQFKMIQNLSQPSVSSEPLSDAELSKDPREFYAYHERREMAENEVKKLLGESVSQSIDFGLPRPERQRRPGLLPNRRPVTYKDLYPSSTLPQVIDTSQPEEVDSRVEVEKELAGSIAKSESKINTLFDELFGGKDLNGDEISALVLDRLQIKSTLDEIPIPVFQASRKDKNSRTALSNIQNLQQRVGGKALVKEKVVKNLSQSLASPRPPLSPFAPISAFQKHIQQSNLSNDRFSALNLSPPRDLSSPGDVDEYSNHLNTGKEFMDSSTSELKSLLPEVNDSTMDNLVLPEMITDGNDLHYDESVKDQFSRAEVSNKTARSTDADFGVQAGNETVNNFDDDGEEAMLSAEVYVNAESSPRIYTDSQTAESVESHENFQIDIMSRRDDPSINDDLSIKRIKSKVRKTDFISHATAGPSNLDEVIPVQHTQDMEEPSEVHLNQTTTEIPPGSGRKSKEVCSSKSLAGVSQNDQGKGEVCTQKGLKRKAKEPLEVPLNDQTNGVPPPKSRKKKDFSRRSSLAAAGSQWEEGGIRRSNRVAVKPLQYWKGERFVYGRLHESLATVIGLKYDSPEKGAENRFNDKRNLKVKSYLSGEFEDLVKKRALY